VSRFGVESSEYGHCSGPSQAVASGKRESSSQKTCVCAQLVKYTYCIAVEFDVYI